MKSSSQKSPAGDARRRLPSVSILLERTEVQHLIGMHSRPVVLDAIRSTLDSFREELRNTASAPDVETILGKVSEALENQNRQRLRPVVNATGIILHTGLGRAVLPQNAVDALAGLNRCCNLQIDLDTGERGKRDYALEQLLCKITGAEAALVVNNNAAATLLILRALGEGREVVVSRGQLIEIGGSYRLPDCVHQSGAVLVEVGTTNKTHLRDYEKAIHKNTAALLRVNPSNYRVVGFTQQVEIAELIRLKRKHRKLLIIDDLGCGALLDLAAFGLPHEPTVQESIKAGADLVCFSGDKLIGGPQAGIIVGKKELIQRIRKHPLTRMLRADKLLTMALEHTLRLFLDPDTLPEKNPTLRMLTVSPAALQARATNLLNRLSGKIPDLDIRIIEEQSEVGGGSLPCTPLPTFALAVRSGQLSAAELSLRLRHNEPPIIARIRNREVLLDMRTLMDGDDALIETALLRMGNSL
jgi:L-seryl-tRNA(Ser) seleniumtransferase